jgi:hypothetical protein
VAAMRAAGATRVACVRREGAGITASA